MDYSSLTEEQIREKYDKLPAHFKSALDSERLSETVHKIAGGHFLNEEMSEMLEQLAGFALLGFVSLAELPAEIETNLGISSGRAAGITEELEKKVFNSFPELKKKSP